MIANNDINLTSTNLNAESDINLTSGNNTIISNAVDSRYSRVKTIKKTTTKKITTIQTDYVETAVKSNLTANNINITSGNNILIQSSDLNSKLNNNLNSTTNGNVVLTANNNVYITDAVLQEYHNFQKIKESRGVYKGLTAITSALIDLATLPLSANLAVSGLPLKLVNKDLYNNLSRKYKDTLYNNSLHNTKIKSDTQNTLTNSISSNINVDRDLVITSNNSINMQASNIYANNNIEFNTNILNILATTTNNITNTTTKTDRTMTIKNNNNGISSTKIIDSNIVSKNNNYNFNINNEINIQRYSGNVNVSDISNSTLVDATTNINTSNNHNNIDNINNISNTTNNNISNNTNNLNSINTNNNNNNINININTPSYIIALRNQSINSNNNTTPKFTETLLSSDIQTWDNTSRQMTTAGQIGVAIGAVALSIATGGIGSGVSGAMMTAAATTAGTIATNTGIQVGMNADGDIFKKIKDTTKEVWDNTTSNDSLRSIAISAGIAGLAKWAFTTSGGNESLKSGGDAVYKPSEELIKNNPDLYGNYNGVIDVNANNIGLANVTNDINLVGKPIVPYSNNPFTLNFWEGFAKEGGFISKTANKLGGMNSMATYIHDPWSSSSFVLQMTPVIQLTIVPATFIQYCAMYPEACGVVSGAYNQ